MRRFPRLEWEWEGRNTGFPRPRSVFCVLKAYSTWQSLKQFDFAGGQRTELQRCRLSGAMKSVGLETFQPGAVNLLKGERVPDRKSVVEGKSVSVRVDRGCRRIIKKKKKQT